MALPPSSIARRRAASFGVVAALVVATTGSPSASAAPKKPRSYGTAAIVSIDGPGRLTLRAKRGTFKARLGGIDTPEPGECGADESTAALKRLAQRKRKRGRLYYMLWESRRTDAEDRYSVIVGQEGDDSIAQSLGAQLVSAEWASAHAPITVSEGDDLSMSVGYNRWTARPLRGLWARCGGYVHLPASAAVPPHAAASWSISADGVTEAIGGFSLSPSLAPGATPTVADFARVARIEPGELTDNACIVRVPSMELSLWATRSGEADCSSSEVFAIATTGPSAVTANRGLRVGTPVNELKTLFPRLASTWPEYRSERDPVPLAGESGVPWAWQTLGGVEPKTQTLSGLLTSASPWAG